MLEDLEDLSDIANRIKEPELSSKALFDLLNKQGKT
jgi:hypothetical protein